MPDIAASVEWSPADHPYAIAVSEAMWWRCAVQLAAARLTDPVDPRASPVSSRQIDARNLVFALVQMLSAEQLEQKALIELGMDSAIGAALNEARGRYLEALPGIQDIRNALTHFDEWAMGSGRGLQKASIAVGSERRDVAGLYWGFGYYPDEGELRLGPFKIAVAAAVPAAVELAGSIDAAARAVDRARRGHA